MSPDLPDFLSYHKSLADLLETEEDATWEWFSSDKISEKAFDENRLMLLKNTVRLDTENHAPLFDAAQSVADMLGITAPISLYQGADAARNAALFYTPNEINIMFQGDILDILTEVEIRCLLGHEMAHYLHKTRENERYFTADRMLGWICGEMGAHPAHARSLWLSQIYQEVFADRIGLAVCSDRDAAISMLIKVTSGLQKFSVDTYLEQAREALDLSQREGTKGQSHPEAYIRAIALDAWAQDPLAADETLTQLVEGDHAIDSLDLLAQQKLTKLTRHVIDDFLTASWANSEAVLAHAATYFPHFEAGAPQDAAALAPLKSCSDDVKDYMACVLLDFATADPDLEDEPLRDALSFAARFDLSEQIERRVVKDLKVPKKQLALLRPESSEAAS